MRVLAIYIANSNFRYALREWRSDATFAMFVETVMAQKNTVRGRHKIEGIDGEKRYSDAVYCSLSIKFRFEIKITRFAPSPLILRTTLNDFLPSACT